jgi:hypothetical protein
MSANVSQNMTNIQQPTQQQQQTTNSESFITSLQNQLKELENKFSQQLSELRERLHPAFKSTAKDKMQTEPANNTTTHTKPLNYSVVYSSSSTYKDGKRDLKEHVEVKNPEMNLIADRLPDKEEFEVKVQKEGDKEPTTQTVPVHQLKQEIDKVYSDIQHKTRDEFSRLGLPFGRTAGSLFGSRDLPMLGGNTSSLAIEPEGSLFGTGSDNRSLATRPAGNDFFADEIRNIEREMEFMRRRMEDEMRRFFDF